MSNKALNWAFDDEKHKGNERLLIIAIADQCNDEGFCYPSTTTLAKKVNVTKPTIKRLLKSLRDSGDVGIVLRPGTSSHYYLNAYRKECGLEVVESTETESLTDEQKAEIGKRIKAAKLAKTSEGGIATDTPIQNEQEGEGVLLPIPGGYRSGYQGGIATDTQTLNEPPCEPKKHLPVCDTGEIRVLQKEDLIPDVDIPFAKHDPEIDAAAEEERQAQPDIAMPELEWEPMEKAVGQVFKAYGAKAKHLINMLWGRSKTGKWAAGNLDQPMPHSELLRFGNWYKSSQSAWRDPSSLTAEDIQSLVIQFRLEAKKKQEIAAMPEPEGAQGPNDPTAWMAKPVTTDKASANEAKRSA